MPPLSQMSRLGLSWLRKHSAKIFRFHKIARSITRARGKFQVQERNCINRELDGDDSQSL